MTTRTKYLRGAVVPAVALLLLPLHGARAGQGASTACSDGPFTPPGTEVPILTTPITLALEVGRLDPTSSPYGHVCFSTTNTGNGNAAIVGGNVHFDVTPSGVFVTCDKDSSPVVLGIDCTLRDDNPTSPGRTLQVTLWVQGMPVTVETGIEVGTPAPGVCLKNTTIYTPAGNVPISSVGVCL